MLKLNAKKIILEVCINYFISFILVVLIATTLLIKNSIDSSEILGTLTSLGSYLVGNPLTWLLLLFPYVLFCLFRYIYQGYKAFGVSSLLSRSLYGLGIPVLLLFIGNLLIENFQHSENFEYSWKHEVENKLGFVSTAKVDSLQRGIHLFGRRSISDEDLEPLIKNNIEWITLVPYGWQESISSTQIGRRDEDYSTYTSRDSSYMEKITLLKSKGFKIMIKPHIWMRTDGDGWRSDIAYDSDQDWKTWMDNYTAFIMHYAKIAELTKSEQFCIGAELHQVVKHQPQFWKDLISKVRSDYSGKLTYAANWYKEVDDVSFWNDLDYIGIQAYYPLCKESTPTVPSLVKGWKKHLSKIESYSKKYNKPILFTELGYKSTPEAAIEPWEWANSVAAFTKISNETQANCYEAFFKTFWNKPWFAGVHLWEWQAGSRRNHGRSEINFTPQQKPAENVMAKWFERKK